jgi:allantoin racemase
MFGCTGMVGLAQAVEDRMRREGISAVPVIDPPVLAVKIAEALAEMGLTHSKRTYPAPPAKEIVGY